MRTLYHIWLSPHCRKVRIALKEKGLDCDLQVERAWERREAFLALNPAGEVPVLVEADGRAICDSQVICEYLDEAYPDRSLIGFDPAGRAETRRLTAWFDQKFGREVTNNLVGEKHLRRIQGLGGPNSDILRAGRQNLHYHLQYIAYLAERRTWLAGEDFTLADIAGAAHISCLDYLGDVPWDEHPHARDWYARVKSRPSFRPILADHIPGQPPPRHYADLDF